MISIEAHPLLLPPALMSIYEDAKITYTTGNHEEALNINERLHEAAIRTECVLGQIVSKRFIGLCQYRLSRLQASQASLNAALALAKEHGELEQQILIQNHLAATLRRLGLLQEAYDTLELGLEMAPLEHYAHAHARLLGNKAYWHHRTVRNRTSQIQKRIRGVSPSTQS